MVEQLLRMSLTAGIVILVVILIRFLMRKLPKKFSYMLWAAVGFRLLCPISIESKFSIFNAKPATQATAQIERSEIYTNYIRNASPVTHMHMAGQPMTQVRETAQNVTVPEVTEAVSKVPAVDIHTVMLIVWAVVAALIVGYAAYHLVRLKLKLRDANKIEKGIYESPLVASPFAMGLFRPGIYLPVDLPEYERSYLIEHERTHIKRGDLIFKMLAVVALAIHWFNPLVWIAFVLFCRDMEMSCDEIVLEKLGVDIRKNYSISLVTLAQKNQDYSYVVMPTSFSKSSVGKNEVKMRIKNIMGFKKSSRSVAVLAAFIVVSVMLTCVLNACAPAEEENVSETTSAATQTEGTTETTETSETESVDVEEDNLDRSEYMCSRSEVTPCEFEEGLISDSSVLEDEDLIELAQSYIDQGYTLFNENGQEGCYGTLGDESYVFNHGFFAYIIGDEIEQAVWVYKMDEPLFDYYLVDQSYAFSDPEDTVEDDGNVIRYTDSTSNPYMTLCSEFNRETGIGTYTFEWDLTVYDMEETDLDSIDNMNLRSRAQYYQDNGFNIWNIRVSEWFDESLGDVDYPYGTGIRAFRQDQENTVEYYAFIFEGDEEVFAALTDDDTYGEQISSEEDGSVLRVTMEYFDYGGTVTTVFEYDRSTDLITVSQTMPYNPNLVGGTMCFCNEDEFNEQIEDYTDVYGEPIDIEDDGNRVIVTFLSDDGSESGQEEHFVMIYDRASEQLALTTEVMW